MPPIKTFRFKSTYISSIILEVETYELYQAERKLSLAVKNPNEFILID